MVRTTSRVKKSLVLLLGVLSTLSLVNDCHALSKECTALALNVRADLFSGDEQSESTFEISFTKEAGSRGASAAITQGTSYRDHENWISVYEHFSAKGLRHPYLKFGPVLRCTIGKDKVSIVIKGEHYRSVQVAMPSSSRRKKTRPKSAQMEIACALSPSLSDAPPTCSAITTSVKTGGKEVSFMRVHHSDNALSYDTRIILP